MKTRPSQPKQGYQTPEHFMGIPVFVDMHTHLIARSEGILLNKRIVLGASYFYLTERQKKAVLFHEYEHCRRFHYEQRILSVPLLLLSPKRARAIAHRHELEADRYAARQGYGKELMEVLHKHHCDGLDFYPSQEVRAQNLLEAMQ